MTQMPGATTPPSSSPSSAPASSPQRAPDDTLQIRHITVRTDVRTVVDDVSLDVVPGSIVAVLGPNGAGKSELVLALAGVLPYEGEVRMGGQRLDGLDAHAVRVAGIAAVPEGHQLLAGLNVLDNLRAAGSMLDNPTLATEVERALTLFPELRALSAQRAGSLSGGQQQMVAIAQALVCRPRVLLLDEMSLGLAPVIVERLVEVARVLRRQGIGILLIEQFTQLALGLADQCHIMSRGRLQFSGEPAVLKERPELLEQAYLGVSGEPGVEREGA